MARYFFPVLGLSPAFEEPSIDLGVLKVHKRLWETSTFDLATLATRHKLHLPYQLMDVYLRSCALEIELQCEATFDEARDELDMLRLLLYLENVAPFVVPFTTTLSVNEYSGINSRDSDLLRDKLPAGIRGGITSDAGTVEAWGFDITLNTNSSSGWRSFRIDGATVPGSRSETTGLEKLRKALSSAEYRPSNSYFFADDSRFCGLNLADVARHRSAVSDRYYGGILSGSATGRAALYADPESRIHLQGS